MFTLHYLPILISKFSIIFATLIGIVRFGRISERYYPFVYLVWLSFLTEMLASFMVYKFKNNAPAANVYVLLEALLILWLYKNWGIFRSKKTYFTIYLFALPIIWVLDTCIFHKITVFSSLFRIIYSFVIVLCSIDYISNLFFDERRNILRNASFLISMAFLVYFSFKGLLEFFYLFRVSTKKGTSLYQFYHHLLFTMGMINSLSNFIFALAMLWIPKKDTYILPY